LLHSKIQTVAKSLYIVYGYFLGEKYKEVGWDCLGPRTTNVYFF